jgi:hypothetical protein
MIAEFSGGPMDGTRRELDDLAGAYWMPRDSVFTGKRNVHHYVRVNKTHLGAVIFEYTGATGAK